MSIAVVGGGITGLAAGYELMQQGIDVSVYEAADRVGGKIATSPVAGELVDAGPDAFLTRVPWATDLCRELGLGDELEAPATGRAYILAEGELRPIPAGAVLGVPTDFDALADSGLVSADGLDRAKADLTLPDNRPAGPESVGSLIRRRLGDEVLDRLVGPLLAGINAGDPDELDLETGAEQLAAAARADPSLVRGLRAVVRPEPGRPVFYGIPGGMARLVEALADQLGDRLHVGSPVDDVGALDADAVIVTVPASAAATLLTPLAPTAAELIATIDCASVVLVTLVYPDEAVHRPLDGSGFLVPASEGLVMTACSWASSKWAHVGAPGTTVLRVSAGRWGDGRAAAMDDESLVSALRAELSVTTAVEGTPLDVRVSRYPASLPQYRPGHAELVQRIDTALVAEAPTVRVAGAPYRGLGLPACIRQGRETAKAVARAYAGRP